jgi:hypothetical protein
MITSHESIPTVNTCASRRTARRGQVRLHPKQFLSPCYSALRPNHFTSLIFWSVNWLCRWRLEADDEPASFVLLHRLKPPATTMFESHTLGYQSSSVYWRIDPMSHKKHERRHRKPTFVALLWWESQFISSRWAYNCRTKLVYAPQRAWWVAKDVSRRRPFAFLFFCQEYQFYQNYTVDKIQTFHPQDLI